VTYERGDLVVVRRKGKRLGKMRLRSRFDGKASGPGWWAVDRRGVVRPIRDSEIKRKARK
jgi:hypothetical protein